LREVWLVSPALSAFLLRVSTFIRNLSLGLEPKSCGNICPLFLVGDRVLISLAVNP
jgi:hypothetical protein